MTTGLLGLACFLVWLFGAARSAARCGFLGFAGAMVAVELVEPLNLAILPLAFLALGAATAVRLKPEKWCRAPPLVNSPVRQLTMSPAVA